MKTNPNGNYKAFLGKKILRAPIVGFEVDRIHPCLYDFQRDIVRWALRLGRAAVLTDCGTGKTIIECEYARHVKRKTQGRILIVAPLSVAEQTIREAKDKLQLNVGCVGDASEIAGTSGIWITNYDRVPRFVGMDLSGIVLDESSVLKHIESKTRALLIENFTHVPYRLCCTATPCPNDIAEIANHAEFLSVMTRQEMLGAFFVHDQDGWRLRGHAREPFFRWLASWSIAMKNPSDLGYDGSKFILPKLTIEDDVIETEGSSNSGGLIYGRLGGITGRSKVRKETVDIKIQRAIEKVRDLKGQGIIWCGLNEESRKISEGLGEQAIEVHGGLSAEEKARRIFDFIKGKYRVLVSKASITGFGLNFQNARWMIFLGLSDSYESYYQCIRRVWRFGQKKSVEAWVLVTDRERRIADNIRRKEQEAAVLTSEIIAAVKEWEVAELKGKVSQQKYVPKVFEGKNWKVTHGDSVEELPKIPESSVDLSIFSPPFLSLYTYSESERDMGNSTSSKQFFEHFGYIIPELLRITKPGRLVCVHAANVAASLVKDGFIGVKNFRGHLVDHFVAGGWIYHGEVAIDKDPQAVAIRTHQKGLLFVQLHKDAVWMSPALADYILLFRKPGENQVPVKPDVSNEEWVTWAHPVWYGIRPTDTLNTSEAKSDKDDRHIAPLQLGTIERCVRLWSNPRELIFSPFAGIGSEGYVAVRFGRRFLGVELKDIYAEAAARNLRVAERRQGSRTLLGVRQ